MASVLSLSLFIVCALICFSMANERKKAEDLRLAHHPPIKSGPLTTIRRLDSGDGRLDGERELIIEPGEDFSGYPLYRGRSDRISSTALAESPRVQKLLRDSLQYIQQENPNNRNNKYKIKHIESASVQLHRGLLWEISATFVETVCKTGSRVSGDHCKSSNGKKVKPLRCLLTIWEKLDSCVQTTVNCGKGREVYFSSDPRLAGKNSHCESSRK